MPGTQALSNDFLQEKKMLKKDVSLLKHPLKPTGWSSDISQYNLSSFFFIFIFLYGYREYMTDFVYSSPMKLGLHMSGKVHVFKYHSVDRF